MTVVNGALAVIDHRPGTSIRLEVEASLDPVIRDFRSQLVGITSDTVLGDDDAYAKTRLVRVKELLDRFAVREGQTSADQSWTMKVTDVRSWFSFAASERTRRDDTEVEHF